MDTDIHNNCLVCSQLILSTNRHLDKLEALFLLRVLLDIPQDSQLLYPSQSSNSLSICEHCCAKVKTCKQIYTQIETQVNKFWELQSEILCKIQNQPENLRHQITNQYYKWVDQCRKFVKNHYVVAFRYPFVYHDLHKLLDDPLVYPESSQDPLSIQNEDDDIDDDVSEKYESSEEDDGPPPQFYWNPNTRQFHCSLPTCTVSNKIKVSVERHFRREHLQRSKTSYTCSWPPCGKVFKKRANHQSHLDKHRGTPTLKCGKCGKLFYYPKGLKSHQSKDSCSPIQPEQAASSSNIMNHFSTLTSTNQDLIGGFGIFSDQTSVNPQPSTAIEITDPFMAEHDKQMFKEEVLFDDNEGEDDTSCNKNDEKAESSSENDSESCSGDFNEYACSWPGCGKWLRDEISLSDHMDRHRGTPKQKCVQCGHLFYSLSNLLNHQRKEHAKLENRKDTLNSKSEEESDCKLNEQNSEDSSDVDDSSSESPPLTSSVRNKTFENNEQPETLNDNVPQRESDFSTKYPQYKFVRNPSTGKFHCLESTCSISSLHKWYMEKHFKVDHLKLKEKKSYSCSWPGCSRVMSSYLNMKAHVDQHKGTPQWKCDHCQYECFRRSDLLYHLKKWHGLSLPRERTGPISRESFKKDALTGRYTCPEKTCNKTYKHIRNITDHYKVEHLKVKEKSGFVCEFDECAGRLFGSRRDWEAHMNKHRKTPQFKCEQCNYLCYFKHSLARHQRMKHEKEEKLNSSNQIVLETKRDLEDFIDEDSCPSNSQETITNQDHSNGNTKVGEESFKAYDFRKDPLTGRFHCLVSLCSKSYNSKQYVTKHYEKVHLKIEKKRSYPCEWDGCGKVIGDKQTWQSHMDKHRGTPKYECKKCDTKFYWRIGYLRHIRTCHEDNK